MTKPELSPRQQDAYDFIKSHIEDVGWPPTAREICDEMDVATNAAYLTGLVEKGWVETVPRNSRCIRLAGYRVKLVKVK